ncbi:hypothetical protein FHU10_0869 [Serratia fonticola]|jgi:hypothetical protein|uniref:DUF7480 domain-containing protein n=1 Tax=Serratia fonticola TaxID=47917 RepID=A0A542BKF7_SERFO|nr:putative T6SS immunity periplasmic lipoprotein [Serratia fonticola]TQI79068.1 hypothetical protein FHU09_1579 [Serratia fonticola]TQI98910.1 hypothetical protein FHU11_4471 [Serratia fonticola]TVZ68435.1 hypothetical protein FHU10_0869 [Serratia fonticola]
MFKKISFLYILFSLSGCFLGDKVTLPSRADAFFVAGTLCLTTPGSAEQQKVKGLTIEKIGEIPGFQKFISNDDEYITVKKGGCIPTFDYKFETGQAYHITIYLTPNDRGRNDGSFSRDVYATSIVIWKDGNNVQHASLLNGG